MGAQPGHHVLAARDLEPILAVAAKLAAPFDLTTMLARGGERRQAGARGRPRLRVALRRGPRRARPRDRHRHRPGAREVGHGLVGTCARTRALINVPDCYSDPRFDPELDRRSGYRTRCMLTMPLVDHRGRLVGVMQVLNKSEGVFESEDEALATVLAAQCAVALQRVRMTEALIEGEKLRQQLEMARVVQMSTLPRTMPAIAGYDVYGTFKPGGSHGRRYLRPRRSSTRACSSCWRTRRDTASRRRCRSRRCRRCCGWPSASAPTSRPPSRRSTTSSPTRSRTIASSPRSSACSIRRRIACASTAAGRDRSCTFTRRPATCTHHKPTSFPLARDAAHEAAPVGRDRARARRHPRAGLRRHLRIQRTRRRGVRRGSREGSARGPPRQARRGDLRPALRGGAGHSPAARPRRTT